MKVSQTPAFRSGACSEKQASRNQAKEEADSKLASHFLISAAI